MVKINQEDYINANFGFCLRSSSIFYIPPKHIKTSIILSNYWDFKNNIKVFLLANYRNMQGDLIKREKLDFQERNVLELDLPKDLIGSCEIESFSNVDLRIPFSAIMAVYEGKKSISMVHSYSRIYSQHEIEDKKTICDGHEGCWILKDTNEIESFAVFHNGSTEFKKQIIEITITNHLGKNKSFSVPFNSMKPYETKIIKPRHFFSDICEFLEGKYGSCVMHYKVSNAFTRLLLGWETTDKSQAQFTHSNFDYATHETNLIDCDDHYGHMYVPEIPNKKVYAIVYPDRSPGEYTVSSELLEEYQIPASLFSLECKPQHLKFKRTDGKLPSRIVTALKIKPDNEKILPCECSLGIKHQLLPKKRFHWGIWSAKFNSLLIITAFKSIYGESKNPNICIRLYGQKTIQIEEKIVKWDEISSDNINACLNIKEFFNSKSIDMENFMYISLFSDYGGFFAYTTLEKGQSITIDHTF